jgi:hypothetical protein
MMRLDRYEKEKDKRRSSHDARHRQTQPDSSFPSPTAAMDKTQIA